MEPAPSPAPARTSEVEEEECLNEINSYNKENLKKWKSLEGDWRTFRNRGFKEGVHSDFGEPTSSEGAASPEPLTPTSGDYEHDWKSVSASSAEDGCMKSTSTTSGSAKYSEENFQPGFETATCPGVQEVVDSSYPLLQENFTLLEKLKKERDVCRQLECDMRNLEGQIQYVSKSFELESENESIKDLGNESETGYSLELAQHSSHLSGSFDHIYGGHERTSPAKEYEVERVEEYEVDPAEDYEADQGEVTLEEDPLLVVEHAFSRLLILADRLESALRESDAEYLGLSADASLRRPALGEWCRERRRELSRVPVELRCTISELQLALRRLLYSKGWFSCQDEGDRESSSPASFTFQGFSSSGVIVPTVRAIFTQVGDSMELRPLWTDPGAGAEERGSWSSGGCSPSSRNHGSEEQLYCPADEATPPTSREADERARTPPDPTRDVTSDLSSESPGPIRQPEGLLVAPTMEVEESHGRSLSEIILPTNYEHSSEIIKRIERLQELVRPELCESLKQRALRIQRAKEEFLSGVSRPSEPCPTDIVVDEVPAASPPGLTVRDQEEVEEDQRPGSGFPFLRKKRRPRDRPCSLAGDGKGSDWLRNPFRPRGKYRISK